MAGKKETSVKLNKTLLFLITLLNDNNIKNWFVCYGTLLGLVRENSCIDNDDDIDMPFVPDRLIMNIGDCHIYKDHYEHVTEQLCRKPYPFPQIKIKDRKNIEDFEWTDIEITDYLSHPKISADMVA